MIKKVDITCSKAFEYLREQLNMSNKTLSNEVRKLPIEAGNVYSMVPDNIDLHQLHNYGRGGIYTIEKNLAKDHPTLMPIRNDARTIVIENIKNYLSGNKNRCCIFEEPNAIPSDGSIKNSGIEYLHIKNEIFYYFSKTNNNNYQTIERAFKQSEAFYFLCVLSSLGMDQTTKENNLGQISKKIIQKIVSKADSFIVLAYDHEGYIVWEKR